MQVPLTSSRTLRSQSTKRARSPGTTSPTNRPIKRLSLAVNENLTAVYPKTDCCAGWHDSGNSSRHPSEDWVQQAGGLTIGSPLEGGYCFSSRPSDVGEDENMTVDTDQIEIENTPRPTQLPPQTNTSFCQLTTSIPVQHSSQHRSPLAPTPHPPCPVPSQRAPSFDSAPYNPPIRPGARNAESTQSMTRPSSPTAMTISPTSWNANTIPTTNRKQRFTMGPRADCHKCLLGVKGHWVHFE